MSNDLEQKRNYIYKMYPGNNWHNKVMAMPPAQVIAIYQKMKNRNQKPVKVRKEDGRQLNLFKDFGLTYMED